MDIQFTDREIDVMEVLWDRGPSLVADVRTALRDELAYTTVLTILRTLEAMYGLPKSGAQQPNAAGFGIGDDAIITDVFSTSK